MPLKTFIIAAIIFISIFIKESVALTVIDMITTPLLIMAASDNAHLFSDGPNRFGLGAEILIGRTSDESLGLELLTMDGADDGDTWGLLKGFFRLYSSAIHEGKLIPFVEVGAGYGVVSNPKHRSTHYGYPGWSWESDIYSGGLFLSGALGLVYRISHLNFYYQTGLVGLVGKTKASNRIGVGWRWSI